MRPSDFIIPEKRLSGHSIIHDRAVLLKKDKSIQKEEDQPELEDSFLFPSWEHSDLFGNSHPVHVEYCSGNGTWIAARAAANPNINWVAVEIKLGRSRKIWSKIKNMNLKNLIVVNGEGKQATEKYFPKGSVGTIFINFPDPWPKRHHAKNRIVNPAFLEAMHAILKTNGEVIVVTDDAGFSDWTIMNFKNSQLFESAFEAPNYITEWPNYGDSYFDSLWREKGRTIRYHHFIKKPKT